MSWKQTVPEWKNAGTEPSAELLEEGFKGGYKPPASVFNWFFHAVGEVLAELQNMTPENIGALSKDLSNLEKNIPIDKGGTGANVRKEAMYNIASLGVEPIATVADDTVENWNALGTGFAWYGSDGRLKDQPTSYAILVNIAYGSDLTQFWIAQPIGRVYKRSGSSAGWDGTWFKSYDEKNKPTADDIGAAKTDLSNVNNAVFAQKATQAGAGGTPVVPATRDTSTGNEVYKATVEGLGTSTRPIDGYRITIIPDSTSTSARVRLQVNNQPSYLIKFRSLGESNEVLEPTEPWIHMGVPITLTYSSYTGAWLTDTAKPNATDLIGEVAVSNGGTGADNAESARMNLGAQKAMWSMASDLHSIVANTFVRWNTDTENTPYKAGLTTAVSGSCYVDMLSNNFRTIYCFTTTLPKPQIFAQSCQTEGWTTTWSDWVEIKTTGERPIVATSTDGVAYTATAPSIVELYNGLEITVIPNMASTSTTITLDLNGFGAKNIRMVLPFNSGNSGALPTITGFFGADAPITLRYHEKMNCWKTDLQRQSAQALYGTVPVTSGGTGLETLTPGSYLVGSGTNDVVLKTPAEVLEDIGAAQTQTMTTAEYEALKSKNANTLYVLIDGDEVTAEDVQKNLEALEKKLKTENWTFTLEDGSTVTKAVYVG